MWMPNVNRFTAKKQRALVESLRDDIRSGRLSPGMRLPTQRDLAAATGVAVGTIARAYGDANSEGLIKSSVGRGSYVARRSDAFLQATGAESESKILDFRVDYPIYALDPPLAPVLQEILAEDCQNLLTYRSHAGDLTHRAAGVEWLKKCGVHRNADQIVLTGGAQHGLVVSLSSITQPGQVVLAEELSYAGLKEAAELLGLTLVAVPMDDEGVIPDALEHLLYEHRNAAVFYTSPSVQNPTTVLTPQHRRKQIAALIDRHGLMIIEDDIQRLLADDTPEPYAQLLPERTFYLCSLSKVVCGGLRIAYLCPPEARIRMTIRRVLATQWTTPPLMAEIAKRWIEDGTAQATLEVRRLESRKRQSIATKLLSGHQVKYQAMSLYGWIDLPSGWTSDRFVATALEAGVAVLSEGSFSVSAEAAKTGVRYCLGVPENHQQITRGIKILATILSEGPGYGDHVM